MKNGSNGTPSLNELFSKVAESIFENVSPSVLLIGPRDEKFDRIQKLYTWSHYYPECPEEITLSTQIVITNSEQAFHDVEKQNLNHVAHLAYLEDQIMPLEVRARHKDKLTSFVFPISEKYITSHIRVLLQIQSHTYCNAEEIPVFLSDPKKMDIFIEYLTSIDKKAGFTIAVPDLEYFKKLYNCFSKQTRHNNSLILEMSKLDNVCVQLKSETLIICVANEKELNQAKVRFEGHSGAISYVVVSDNCNEAWVNARYPNLKMDLEEAYLIACYKSILKNTKDEEGKTRFLQKSSIENLFIKNEKYDAFCKGIENTFIDDKTRFKNVPPLIKLPIGKYPYSKIVESLINEIYGELFSKTNMSGELSELVSGTPRTTLEPKLKLVKRED